jgi:hypothetical protein
MAFEIFSRRTQWGGTPSLTFTKLRRFAFNKSATAQLEKIAAENVLLMWDKEKRFIGIRPITKKDSRAYKVHYGKKGNGAGFSATTFLKYIGYKENESRTVSARWDEQEAMFIAEVPEQYLQKEQEQRFPPIPPVAGEGRKRRIRQPE